MRRYLGKHVLQWLWIGSPQAVAAQHAQDLKIDIDQHDVVYRTLEVNKIWEVELARRLRLSLGKLSATTSLARPEFKGRRPRLWLGVGTST